MAAPAEDDAVAERQHRVRSEVEARQHPGGQRDLFGDDAALADLDPALAEDRALGEGQPGARAEPAEAQPPRMLGRDGPGLLHPAPPALHGAVEHPTPPGGEGRERVSVPGHPDTVVGTVVPDHRGAL
ncbi:hypothetical protein [Streptomyces sp. adm13(2018)]|uniref:hypothetical protein n=1 Tax=Streptomyces sp. adm13(2018) TaxID=2479007 RepID=UPI0021C838FB|nr:hypothetical protein [Streptomyces sp. adm13(2018)]